MLISVVAPCYNEEAVLEATHGRLRATLESLPDIEYEIIYVDDGSIDGTAALLRNLHERDQHTRVVGLSRNFGHQIAITAGLEHAKGAAVVIIDADLQDPPELISEMVGRWRDGYDVVYAVRTERQGERPFKLWTARLFYRLINRAAKVQIPLDVGDFRLMSRRVVDALLQMPEKDRFLRAMVSWAGFKQIGVFYRREPRAAGLSKYPFFKMVAFALDGVLSFSFTPLRLAIWTGFAAIAFAFGGIVYAILLRLFTTDWVRGWASLFVAVLLMSGVQLVSLGIIGEYIGRIYREVKGRPLYLVQTRLGFAEKSDAGQRE
ncbi:MAG: glycosyltransferase family 2 protein [Chthoniobacterales bacterium]